MARTVNGLAQPDDPNQVPGDVNVVVTVPEQFVGVSLGELNARGGHINGMKAQETSVTISATLRAFHYNALVEAIRVNTDGRGGVAQAES